MTKFKISVLSFLLLTVPAFACDSYDECMLHVGGKGEPVAQDIYTTNATLKAIAYKLDEIADLLAKPSVMPTFTDDCFEICFRGAYSTEKIIEDCNCK